MRTTTASDLVGILKEALGPQVRNLVDELTSVPGPECGRVIVGMLRMEDGTVVEVSAMIPEAGESLWEPIEGIAVADAYNIELRL